MIIENVIAQWVAAGCSAWLGRRISVVRADEKLTAFVELKAATRAYDELSGQANGKLFKTRQQLSQQVSQQRI